MKNVVKFTTLSFFAVVFGIAEGENELEDVWDKDETNFEGGRFFEGIAKFNSEENVQGEGVETGEEAKGGDNSCENATDERDQENINPEVEADDAAEDINVVNWN